MIATRTEEILPRRVVELELVDSGLGCEPPVDQGRHEVADAGHCRSIKTRRFMFGLCQVNPPFTLASFGLLGLLGLVLAVHDPP